jgi:hypothetical protein
MKAAHSGKSAAGFLQDNEAGGTGFAVLSSKFAAIYFPFTAND